MMNSDVVDKFVDRINAHDIEGLISLMSPDHVFVDSLGEKATRPAIESGWRQYFAMVPDYWVKVDRLVPDESAMILFGRAGGTYVAAGGVPQAQNKWETPAVWRAEIRDGKVSEWRIYADNEPIRAKMRTSSAQLDTVTHGQTGEKAGAHTAGQMKGGSKAHGTDRTRGPTGAPGGSPKDTSQEVVDWKKLEEEARKKLEHLSPQKAQERYDFLSSKPITELTDSEYEERLRLAEKLSQKPNKKK